MKEKRKTKKRGRDTMLKFFKDLSKRSLNEELFMRYFCTVMIPRLRKGSTLEEAWNDVKDRYFHDFEKEKIVMDEAFEFSFSADFRKEVERIFYAPVFLKLLTCLSEMKYKKSMYIADELAIFEIDHTKIPYSVESRYPRKIK